MFWSNVEDINQMVYSKAFQQGLSFVETLRIKDGACHYLKAHLNRVYQALNEFQLIPFWSYKEACVEIQKWVEESGQIQGRGRLQTVDVNGIQFFVFCIDGYCYDHKRLKVEGFELNFAPYKRPAQDRRYRYKTNNYLSALIDQKGDNSYQETLYINSEGHIAEGTKTNVFFVKQHHIYTPAIDCNILNGIMRQEVINLLMGEGFDISVGCYTIEDIVEADHVFLTNSLMPIGWVKTLNGRYYNALSESLSKVLETL